MFATIRRIALALAGAAALVAAGRARADHDRAPGFPAGQPQVFEPPVQRPQAYAPPATREPGVSLSFSVALPPPPAWLAIAPPPIPAYGIWSRPELQREYRWLEMARVRFYRHGASSPWRARQFEAWYQARRAGLDRRLTALAWAPGPRHSRDDRWDGRRGEGRERGERD
jgi:hypothetical protein